MQKQQKKRVDFSTEREREKENEGRGEERNF